jgi:DNA helicase-2/ATP-dependent DNA helicase PcrA
MLPLPEVIEHVIERSGLRQHYLGERDGQDRLENLDELVNAATVFASDATTATDENDRGDADRLSSFLAHASLEAGEHQAGDDQEAVQLMTVHSAKGLEFDVVFITGLEQGLFPHENAVQERDGIEEERRLMYVAVTRARRRLYLTHAETRLLHGQTRYCLPSVFLDELPAELLHRSGRASGTPRATGSPAGKQQTAGDSGLRIGQSVRHARFGVGVIVASEGSGEQARVQINFGSGGMKWLALSLARLTPA